MSPTVVSPTHPFNRATESGLRSLFLLVAFNGIELELERLVYLDYLLVHSGDIGGGPESLHPAIPYRGGEWLLRRQHIEKGLEILVSRELVMKCFRSTGITYSAADLGIKLTEHFESDYSIALKSRAVWVKEHFGHLTFESLRKFLYSKMSDWGTEFKNDDLIYGIKW